MVLKKRERGRESLSPEVCRCGDRQDNPDTCEKHRSPGHPEDSRQMESGKDSGMRSGLGCILEMQGVLGRRVSRAETV